MGTTGRENRKKGTPAPRKSGAAPQMAAKRKPGAAAVPVVDAEPREPLIPPHVARFLASIPMTPDPVEWILGFRAALQELLGDVDRIAMTVNAYCRVNGEGMGGVWFRVNLERTYHDNNAETDIGLEQWGEYAHHIHFLERLQRAGHDMGAYHEPIGMDYEYRDAGYLASMLLFRERYRPGISDRTLQTLGALRPFMIYCYSSQVARGMAAHPAKHFARLTIERMLNDRRFTQREREVIVLAFMGLTYAGIAERLFITEHTVKKRLESIRRKTGTGSFFELFMQHVPKEE